LPFKDITEDHHPSPKSSDLVTDPWHAESDATATADEKGHTDPDDNNLPDCSPNFLPLSSEESAEIRKEAKELGASSFVALYTFGKKFNLRRLVTVFRDQFVRMMVAYVVVFGC
jgi:hypothetical protein